MNRKVLLLILVVSTLGCRSQSLKTQNVILITLDGFRWKEMFAGADEQLMEQQTYLKDPALKEKFWRETAEARRKALLPFFWNVISTKGQLYGNRELGCNADVTNTMLFSYPGYNEILTGKADDININSNEKKYNPNVNILEFINQQKGFEGKVAAFTSWDVFPYIINDKRSGIYVSTDVKPVEGKDLTEREKMMNDIVTLLPNPFWNLRLDAFTFNYGLEYMKKHKPRVLYFAFGETDDFAHQGEYGQYLNSAHSTDEFIRVLWDYIQSDSQYKDKTTLIITTDHGRGASTESWKHHNKDYPEASQIWIAVLGPDSRAIGEVKDKMQLHQNQIASTIASLLRLKFNPTGSIGSSIPQAFVGK